MHARNDNTSSAYLLTMLVTSALALLVLGSQVALNLSSDSRQILDYADDALCAVFFIDFCVTLWRSPNRIRYFFTWGWVDLLSSIPSIDAFRLGRGSRVFRIFRVLRAIRAAKILAEVILLNRAKNVVLAITLIAGLIMVFASIGILHVETVPEANIKTPRRCALVGCRNNHHSWLWRQISCDLGRPNARRAPYGFRRLTNRRLYWLRRVLVSEAIGKSAQCRDRKITGGSW